MYRPVILCITLILLLGCSYASLGQSAPVVTIDANKNFCINGVPTYIIGTIGGSDTDWQTHLGPAGFNVRFLGSTTKPGAHSAGLWEAPDVAANTSLVSSMKNNPNVLTWTLGYQVDSILREQYRWMGYTPIDIVNKREQCISLDKNPPHPVGVIWGNDTSHYGYEFWARDGYWYSTRQFAQLGDYFVSGDINVIEDQTISNSVRMTNKPVIAMFKCIPGSSNTYYLRTPEYHTQDMWTAVVTGAKGILLDRYETEDGLNWVSHLDISYWNGIKKAASEIKQLTPALTAPGPWIYYKNKPNEVDYQCLIWTHRMVGSDMYVIVSSLWRMFPISDTITAPIMQSTAKGEVLFDNLTKGILSHPPTSTTITDASKTWTTNQFAGHRLWIRHGSPSHEHKYTVLSNTSNTITISGGDLLADGAAKWDYYYVNEMVSRSFNCYVPVGGRKVVKYENVTTYVNIPKAAEAVGKPSNRRWVELMDWSSQYPGQKWIADGYGLAYDANRHRLVCYGGVNYTYPDGKPNAYDPDVWFSHYVSEWDLDSNYYSGLISQENSAPGDGWSDGSRWSDLVYHPQRQTCMTFEEDGSLWEWRGQNLGWKKTAPTSPRTDPGEITHYAACHSPMYQRFLMYGGKDNDHPGMQGRGMQFIYEWVNQLYGFDDTGWHKYGNPDTTLPYSPLEEPQMVWDSGRNVAVLFGCSHDGVRNINDIDPIKVYQDVPQQTYEIDSNLSRVYKNTAHVPYVFANYRMCFDPRTNTTLLFGGLPSKNGRITDLYEYNGTDWSRLDYDYSALPAQDVRRTPSLVYDPDHQMIIFLDTRTRKIWGLTSGNETTVTSIDAARSKAIGTSLVLEGMYVSRVFDGYFYMQDAARTTGIRVVSTSAPAIGQKVNVIGTLQQNGAGEKYLQAKVVGQTGAGTVEPVAMSNTSVGGKATASRPGVDGAYGPNNTGILVRVWGRVSYIGQGYIYIDDGSAVSDGSGHTGVKVQMNGVALPALGETVAVTGISALEKSGTTSTRVVLLSRAEDLSSY